MNRRQLLSISALALALVAPRILAADAYAVDYARQVYEQALASGKPFMLEFFATW
jgi:hypothetical protein